MTTLQQYRNRILNPSMLVTILLSIGLLIYDSLHFAQPLLLYENFLVLFIILICGVSFIFRRRLNYSFRAWAAVLSFFIIAIYNFYILGYAEFGSLSILVCIVACYVFLNLRQAIFVSSLSVLTVTFIFILYLNNMIPKNCSIDFFINSREIIYSRLFTDILYIASISTVLYFLIYYFNRSLKAFEISNKELDENNAALINEIEKSKQLEQTNRFQEYKFSTIFNNLKDAVLIIDYNMVLLEANKTLYERIGYSREEINKKVFYNLVVPEQRNLLVERITSLIKTGSVGTSEYTVVSKDNEKIVIEVNSSLMLYDETPVVLSILRDITQRKKDELEIIESRKKLENIIDIMSDWVWEVDKTGNYTFISNKIEEVLGYKSEELIGKSSFSLLDTGETERINDSFNKIISQRKPFSYFETVNLHKNGQQVCLETSGAPIFSNDGIFCGYRGVSKDVTENKKAKQALVESEEKFRSLFNYIKVAMMVIDFDLKILEVNNEFVRSTGISREDAVKVNPLDFLPEKYRPAIVDRLKRLTNELLPPYEAEFYSPVLEQMVPIEFNGTKIVYKNKDAVLSIIRDLRDVKQNEKNILNAVIDAEEKQRAYFASELHDGAIPLLSTIKLYLQWMGKPDVKADKKELLAKAGETLEQAYNSLREISNNLSPHILQNFGLGKAIHAFVEQLKLVSPVKFDIKWVPENSLSPEKERAIYRILTECINNTMKHSDAQNVSIIFNTSRDMIYINYFDDGKGFDSDKVLSQSTGTGFYNIRSRIKSVGGTMNIESKPGQGVKKMFNIPL